MSQIAIICLFEVDRLTTSPDAFASDVLDTLKDDGLPIISCHAWGGDPAGSPTNLGAIGALASTTAGLAPQPLAAPLP